MRGPIKRSSIEVRHLADSQGVATYLLDFSNHLFIDSQRAALRRKCGDDMVRVSVPLQVDRARRLTPQIEPAIGEALDQARVAGWSGDVGSLLVLLPGLAESAAVVLAGLHGFLGVFPVIACRRPSRRGSGGFIVSEARLRLDQVRERARAQRR